MKIPHIVIKGNLGVEDFEISYAEGGYIPIKKLNPSMKWDWRIKARVTKKGEKRNWKNERGEGYLMNIELIDEDGAQIQATLFKDIADKFADILYEGHVYVMAGGLIKESSGRFATLTNSLI